nr:hypothetical protein [Actinomadura sp. BRA 177]
MELLARHVRHRRRDRRPVDPPGRACHVPEHVRGERDLDGERRARRLAAVERLQFREFLGVLGDEVADAVHDAAPLARRHGRPRAVGGLAGRGHRAVDVPFRRLRHGAEHRAGAGVDRLEGPAVEGVDELAVDEQPVRPGEEVGRELGGSGHVCFSVPH